MTEQKKVHYSLEEVFAFFPEYTSLEYFRREVLDRLYAKGFPQAAPYSTRYRKFFPKTLVDAYLQPDPSTRPGGLAQDEARTETDWGEELTKRAKEGER